MYIISGNLAMSNPGGGEHTASLEIGKNRYILGTENLKSISPISVLQEM